MPIYSKTITYLADPPHRRIVLPHEVLASRLLSGLKVMELTSLLMFGQGT